MAETQTENSDLTLSVIVVEVLGLYGYIYVQTIGVNTVINTIIRLIISFLGFGMIVIQTVHIGKQYFENYHNRNLNPKLITVTYLFSFLLVIIAGFDIDFINLQPSLIIEQLIQKILYFKYYLFTIFVSIVIILIIKKFIEERRYQRYVIKSKLKSFDNKFDSLVKAYVNYDEFEDYLELNPKISKRYNELVDKIKNNLDTQIKDLKLAQQKKIKKEREERKKEHRKENLINKLVNFFQEKKSYNVIPKWALEFDSDLIKKAQSIFIEIDSNNKYVEETKKEAIEFIRYYESYPSNFAQMNETKQKIYKEIFNEFEKGNLEKYIKVKKEDEDLVEKRFYLSKELNAEQRNKLIKDYGYRHISFTNVEGKLGTHLIIKNNPNKESDYHFCMKNLIARINGDSIMEYTIEDMRADVVFQDGEDKLAIEIETGKNTELQVSKKVKWLDKHFSSWIITVPKKLLKTYNKYVDNEKSFCLTSSKTKEKINEFLQR